MSMTDYIDDRYEGTFAMFHDSLSEMLKNHPDSVEDHIRQTLKNLYVRQGNNWTGRGAIGDAGLDATVNAYECMLAELQRGHSNIKETVATKGKLD